MLVVQKNQSDGDGSEHPHDKGHSTKFRGFGMAVHQWGNLGKGKVEVHTGTDAKQYSDGRVVNVICQNNNDTEEDRSTASKVQDESHNGAETNLVGEQKEVSQFLRQLVEDSGGSDGPGQSPVAQQEGSSDEDSVAKVVEEITEKDSGSQRPVNLFGFGGGGVTDGSLGCLIALFVHFFASGRLCGGVLHSVVTVLVRTVGLAAIVVAKVVAVGKERTENEGDEVSSKNGNTKLKGHFSLGRRALLLFTVFVMIVMVVVSFGEHAVTVVIVVAVATLQKVDGLGQDQE